MQSDLRYTAKSEVVTKLPSLRDAKEGTFYYLKSGKLYKPLVIINGAWHEAFLNNNILNFKPLDFDVISWTDLRSPATAINPPGLISDPTFDTTNMGWSFQVNNEVQIINQMPHEWKEGSEINFHVHYKQTTSAAVGWQIDYRIYNNRSLVPSFTTGLALSTVEFTYPGSGTFAQIQQPTSFIDMSAYRISCLVEVKLRRVADSVPTNVVLTEFDIHYQKDGFGSEQEFIKEGY